MAKTDEASSPKEPHATVEIVYCPLNDASLFHVQLPFVPGMRVTDALLASQLWTHHPEARHLELGIFSMKVPPEHRLKPFDRIEVYQPLTHHPMEKRRKKAADL